MPLREQTLRDLLVGVAEALAAPVRIAYRRLLREVIRHHTPPGLLGEPWGTGAAAMWAAIRPGAYLLLGYL